MVENYPTEEQAIIDSRTEYFGALQSQSWWKSNNANIRKV